MTKTRSIRWCSSVLVLLLLAFMPVLAEISVLLDPKDGSFKKLIILNSARGRGGRGVWTQVRAGIPLELMLNPNGDVRGDDPPAIALHPENNRPWAVWPGNAGNLKEIVFSRWTGTGWSPRQALVANPDPVLRDEINPAIAFDATGASLVVWERDEQVGRILFSTLSANGWTPPLQLSDEGVDSRRPSILVSGTIAYISYDTPSGRETKELETAQMIESATNLMDTPIPPGSTDDPDSGGGGTSDGTAKRIINK